MAVTDMLVAEHDTVLGRLDELKSAASEGDAESVRKLLPFFEEDLKLHRRKEEEVLFPAIANHIGSGPGPVACMLEDHQEEKGLVRRIREALEGPASESDRHKAVETAASRFVDFLKLHIQKENGVLFPLAERVLSIEEKEQIFAAMRKIGSCCDVCAHKGGDKLSPA